MRKQFRFIALTAMAYCVLEASGQAAGVELKQRGDRVDVVIGGKPFTTYYFGPTASKAYLMPLQTARGMVISRPFPVGNDVSKGDPKASSFEPHQRPLYFAHGNIDGLNFWAEPGFQKYYRDQSRQPYGHMADAKIVEVHSGAEAGTMKASFALADPSGRVIGREIQVFRFEGDERQRVIDCDFTLKATEGPLDLGDTKEGTFGIRLGPELSAPLGHMRNSHGSEGEKEIWGKPADWVSYYGSISGQKVGIVVFDHPKSFRHPTTWHARGYGLLAANPFGAREFTADPGKDGSWAIPEGGSLEFKYRVIIYDGDLTPTQIEALYQKYAGER
ncbi:MAG: PmoA family protein [Acidobacteriota bacterium]|nr:PmoA family protein [Acidobacteriota bacterium]